MPIKLTNNASGTLATAISASDTGVALTTGDGAEFPTLGASEYFYATVTSSGGTQEIVKATARSGDSLTIVRAQEGTSAASFAAGARFELRVTAQSIVDTAAQYANDADVELRADLAASGGSSLVGFLQSGGSAVSRTLQSKGRDTVSLADFGAVGNGIANDRTAIVNALATQKPLEWVGTSGNNFRIESAISHTATADVVWYGHGATITYAGAHTEYAIRLNDSTGVEFILNDLTIDGGKLCNKCFEVLNNSDNYSNLTCNNVFVTRAKRLNTFSGGEGMQVRGSFDSVVLNGGGASDCELPAGQGTSGSIGIGGISVTWYSTTRYVRAMYVNGVRIEKIYSSDLAYQDDQDGIKFFSPTDGTRKVPSLFSCVASEFVNCYGRSIKTQCRDTVVQASSFIRTEGLTSGQGNGEIDCQTGNGRFRDLAFSYSNGQQPGTCVNVSGSLGLPGILVDGCSVVLDSATTLAAFAQVYPSSGTLGRHTVSNNKVYGKVTRFFEFLCNGNKNYAEVSNNYVQEITLGVTSERALVYVLTSGATTPFFAYTTLFGNTYGDVHLPALVRDGVPGNSMASSVSAWDNYGFQVDDITKSPTASGLKTNVIARMAKVGGYEGNGYFQVKSASIASGATATLSILNNSRPTLVFITCQYDNASYAFFVNNATSNTGLNVGARFVLGNTTDPGSGVFRVWSSATNEITISNTDASSRSFAVFAMVVS